MDSSDITSWIDANLPETILLIGGLLAILIAVFYVKDKDSWKYKGTMVLGFLFGLLMAVEAITTYGEWRLVTSIFVAVAAFALIIRPFREVHFAIILSFFVMVIIYIAMGQFNGYMLFDQFDLTVLSEGWPRIIVAFIAGAFVYMITNFAEGLVKMFGKLLNFWPVLLILGLVCIVEAVLMLTGNGSIVDYIQTLTQ
ncbi:MAG: hypothetical protein SPF21_00240 [Candidatus Methanomethylophilaceae archaeon]|nr:hypothetical protein [Candidatus Methanomethylophilaceae archaeon]